MSHGLNVNRINYHWSLISRSLISQMPRTYQNHLEVKICTVSLCIWPQYHKSLDISKFLSFCNLYIVQNNKVQSTLEMLKFFRTNFIDIQNLHQIALWIVNICDMSLWVGCSTLSTNSVPPWSLISIKYPVLFCR